MKSEFAVILLEKANAMLEQENLSQDQKAAICTLTESILMDISQYHGFVYDAWINGGYMRWIEDGKPVDNKKYIGEEYNRKYL